jgi:single-stranded-DNA-specific exonuclease
VESDVKMTRWINPQEVDAELVQKLVHELDLVRVVAEVLVKRGYGTTVLAEQFLNPRLSTLSDPFLLPDMKQAVDRILQAIDRRERIVLYGDYDVDGLTSLALLQRVLREYDANVQCFLPQRKEEGYGLSVKGITRCMEEHRPQLLVAIDCGTSSVAEVALLKQKGVDVVILDHHECPPELPACIALVNPKKGNAFGYLCSVGIVFKVSHALLKQRPNPEVRLKEYLDLVALGSVADLVPLTEENRTFVQKGLEQLANTRWQGIKTLAKNAGVKSPWVSADVGFKLGPRLNAAGRLGEARRAFDLLVCSVEEEAEILAAALEEENQNRKVVGEKVLQLAEKQVVERFDPNVDFALVVGGEEWHEGVIGIVASKLMHKYNRPCIVVGFDSLGMGKGSCRSVPGFSLVQALRACAEHLEKSGGHDMAAGLSVRKENFEQFRNAFERYARERLRLEDLVSIVEPDIEVQLHELTLQLLDQVGKLGPFGIANSMPVFLLKRVQLVGQPRVIKERHVSLEIQQGRNTARAIWFNGAQEPLPPPPWDIAFDLTRNEYQGKIQPQIQIRALRSSE